jgi:hypothetical protein
VLFKKKETRGHSDQDFTLRHSFAACVLTPSVLLEKLSVAQIAKKFPEVVLQSPPLDPVVKSGESSLYLTLEN